ncbi:hypothetical protein GCM10020255_105910 [Rhodococcus baikonurensis]
MVCEFLCIPAESDTENHATVGKVIQRCDGFRESDRIVFEGRATEVPSRMVLVTEAAVPRATQGSSVRI